VIAAGIDGLRAVRDDDATALCALIGGVYAEYPGCVLEIDGQDAELLSLATTIAARSGEMWVVERDGVLVACCGWVPSGPGVVQLRRLYVAVQARRQGLGGRLADLVERTARDVGAEQLELWSDTRFTDAHRLYESRGYVRGTETRDLHDASNSVEYHYLKFL
jgi:GNAT superfamily N-acetyltransferase